MSHLFKAKQNLQGGKKNSPHAIITKSEVRERTYLQQL